MISFEIHVYIWYHFTMMVVETSVSSIIMKSKVDVTHHNHWWSYNSYVTQEAIILEISGHSNALYIHWLQLAEDD